jgi:predicted nucleic acid-binding protein
VKIVVDTNIVFSGLLHSSGTIGDLLFNSDKVFQFYSCDYMRFEIEKHWDKLLRLSKLTEQQLHEAHYQLLNKSLLSMKA